MTKTTYTFRHVPGHSAYDHFAQYVIIWAQAEGATTKVGMESALKRAWRTVRPRPGIGPRIDVVRGGER